MNKELLVVQKMVDRLLRSWPVVIVACVFWVALAALINIFSPVFFESKVSIVVEEPYRMDDPQRWMLGEQRFNEPDRSYVTNEGIRMKEYSLVKRAVNAVGLGVRYLEKGVFLDTELYQDVPFRVEVDTLAPNSHMPYEVAIYVEPIDSKTCRLSADDTYGPEDIPLVLDTTITLGAPLRIGAVQLHVIPIDLEAFNPGITYGFALVNSTELALDLCDVIEIEPAELESSIFEASLLAAPGEKSKDILAALSRIYVNERLQERKELLLSILETINQQMKELRTQLAAEEHAIEEYKSGSLINSTEDAGRSLLEEMTALEAQLIELETRQQYLGYLEENLGKSHWGNSLISPGAYGVSDPVLNELIKGHNDLLIREKTYRAEGQTEHPALQMLRVQMDSKASVIQETVKGFRASNNIHIGNAKTRLEQLRSRTAALPGSQMELLRKDRSFAALDLNYKALNQRRMEVEITLASLTTDVNVVEAAHLTTVDPLFPDPVLLAIFIILLTLLSPFIYLFCQTLFGRNIRDLDQVRETMGPAVPLFPIRITGITNRGETQSHQLSQAMRDTRALLAEVQLRQTQTSGNVLCLAHWDDDRIANTQLELLIAQLNIQRINTLIIHLSEHSVQPTFSAFVHALQTGGNPDVETQVRNGSAMVKHMKLQWDLSFIRQEEQHLAFRDLLKDHDLVILMPPGVKTCPELKHLIPLTDTTLFITRFAHTEVRALAELEHISRDARNAIAIAVTGVPPERLNPQEVWRLIQDEALGLWSLTRMLFNRI